MNKRKHLIYIKKLVLFLKNKCQFNKYLETKQ